MSGIRKEDIVDADVIDAVELASDGTTVFVDNATVVSTTASTKTVVISGEDVVFDKEEHLEINDIVVITGTSGGLGDGTFTVASITNSTTFVVNETIGDSTGGTADFIHPSGSTKVGVKSSTLTLSSSDNLQSVLEDIDTFISEAYGRFFDGYDSAGGTNFSSGWTDIPLNGERKKTGEFTHSGSSAEVTINSSDTYVIVGRVGFYQSTGNNRSVAQMRISVDTGSGYSALPGTLGYGYSRNNASGEGTMVATAILDLAASNKIKVQANRLSGAGTIQTIAGGSSLLIFSVKGPQGEKGDTGSGTEITLQDDGEDLENTPHDTINITGTGYTLEDNGDGSATLTLSGGGLDDDRAVDMADFINQVDYGWGAGVAGTGAYQVLEALGGQFQMSSGATSGGAVSIQQDLRTLSVAGKFSFKCRAKLVNTADLYVEFGVQNGSGQYACFSNDGTGGNWRARNSAGGTEASTDNVDTRDTAWHVYGMNCNGSQIQYLIDDVVVATHTTFMPTVFMYAYSYMASTSVGAKVVQIDYFRTETDREA